MNQTNLMQTYSRLPLAFVRGEGVWLWDEDGERYLDGLGGIAVAILGHSHPVITQAISKQAAQLLHTSNLYRIPAQEALASKLFDVSAMERCFFSNSGAEANEAAIKIARKYGHQKGVENPCILVTENSFHGRTLATLSATGNRNVQVGFEPLVAGFRRVPFNDLDAVAQVAQHDPSVVAILVEPIQGEGGVNLPTPGYLQGLREICDRNGWLLMLDEIQTGMGRTGKWFAFQHEDLIPDVVTVAKALGNGIPIGACLAQGQAADVLQPGNHGSTFGGNPFACQVAATVVEELQSSDALKNAQRQGNAIMMGLDAKIGGHANVRSIRGSGLMIGIELSVPCAGLVEVALRKHGLINVTAGNVIRLLPALIYQQEHSEELIDLVCDCIEEFCS